MDHNGNVLLSNLPFGVIVVNSQSKIEFISEWCSEILGKPHEQIIHQFIQDILPFSHITKVIKTGEPSMSFTETIECKKLFLWETVIKSKNGPATGMILLFNPDQVDQIADHSEKVIDLKQEMEAIMNLIGELVTITDGDGKILRVNASCEKVMGVKEWEFVGQPASLLEERGVIDNSSTKKVLEQGRFVRVVQTTKSGRRLVVSGFPIYNEQGKLNKVINISKDITEQDQLNRQLEETKQLVQHYQSELIRLNQRNKQQVVIRSKQMEEVYDLVSRIADVDSTVLILGESGVGKEVIARTIHGWSSRKEKTFLKINCGAIPETLMESELFGYAKGTFTGGIKEGKPGLFVGANHGTLFLDEIGELPLHLQVKLLQVLQEKQVTPLGNTVPIHVDVRFIAATNRNLEEMVNKGSFREDLYYRLNVVPIQIPSLRERKDDIPFLIEHFLHTFNEKYGKGVRIDKDVIQLFMEYPWFGNVRELQNTIERLVVTIAESEIQMRHLPSKMLQTLQWRTEKEYRTLKELVSEYEKNLLQKTLNQSRTLKEASKKLGADISTISRKAKRYNIRFAELQ